MRAKRNILGRLALLGLSAVLALCILSSVSSAQSRDDRKDRTGEDRKREEPKREERSDREPSRDRTADREPARESGDRPAKGSGDRTSREQPSRSDRTGKDRPSTGGRESGHDRSSPERSDSTERRTVPDRSPPGDTTAPDRRRPPRRPGGGDYDRSRDDDGTRPGDPRPYIKPPRRDPSPDYSVRKKEVPIADDRIRIIVEGWPCLPPWYPVFYRQYIVDPGYHYNPYLVHLPFGTIEPREMEEEFLVLLNDLWHDGMQEALLVCIVQTYRAMDVDRFELFFRRDDEVTIYGSFSSHSFLVLLPVRSVFELLDDPRIRWVGEYKSYYKINDSVKLWDWDGAFVFALESDRGEFRDDLLEAGLAPDFYDEELGSYFVPADPYDLERIAEFWWVAEVLQVASDPALVYGYDHREYE